MHSSFHLHTLPYMVVMNPLLYILKCSDAKTEKKEMEFLVDLFSFWVEENADRQCWLRGSSIRRNRNICNIRRHPSSSRMAKRRFCLGCNLTLTEFLKRLEPSLVLSPPIDGIIWMPVLPMQYEHLQRLMVHHHHYPLVQRIFC